MSSTSNVDIKKIIIKAKKKVGNVVNLSKVDSSTVIARYTAAVAVNFTDWIGKSIPWVRHEDAYHALVNNLRCEAAEDHVGMLFKFASLSKSVPERDHYEYTKKEVGEIRKLLRDPATSGLTGVALCAVLENTSEIFIPDLAKKAKACGCNDFTYTDVHGEADIEHSQAFVKATESEIQMGYGNKNVLIQKAVDAAIDLIARIYN